MENGIGVAVDERRLGDGISGFRVGAHVTKDSEGDAFFEAATAENLMEETTTEAAGIDLRVGGNSEEDFGGDGFDNVGHEGRETFEEAIGVPGGVRDGEEGEIVFFRGGEGFDDEVSVSEASVKEGVVENVEVGNVEEGNGEAILGVADDGETVALKGDEVGEKKFDGFVDNSENGNLGDVNVEGMRVKLESVDEDKGGEEGIGEHQFGESNGQILDQEDTIEEENETFVDLDTGNEDDKSGDPGEASSVKIRDEWTRELQEILSELGKGHENDPSEEVKDALPAANSENLNENEEPRSVSAGVNFEHRDDGADEIKSASSSFGTEGQDGDSEVLEGGSISLDSASRDDMGAEMKESPDILGKDAQNKGNDEMRGTSVSLESYTSADEGTVASNIEGSPPLDDSMSENENGNREMRDTSVSLESYTSADEGTVASNIESSPPLEDFTSANEKITPVTSQLGAEDKSVSQPQRAVENGNEVHHDRSVSGEPEKQEVKEEKRRTEHIVNRGMNPAAVVASSSVKSINLTPPPAHPAGLGRGAPLLEPAPRVVQQPRVNGNVSQTQSQLVDDSMNGEAEENDETREKLQMIRVKFLRLAHRLGQTPHNVVVAQVLYRLGLAEQLRGRTGGGRVGAFSFDRASAMAEQLEAAGQEPLDFSCTIMVLGKTGVGKSATINSIFDEVRFGTDAFQSGTTKVQDVVGLVQGIKVRVIDTPGLLTSWSDQRQNEKILQSVKRFIRKTPPDIVLYLDRLDMQSRDFSDMPLLRTITETFGPSIWFNAIVVLTHAASAPPDGPNGTASSYDMFVTQRSHVVQQAIRHAAGDMRLMNPVSLVENHSACRTNRAGQRVLPNGQVWKPHLLLLSFASKILAEANTLLKLQDSPPGKPSTARPRAPPLPFLLSSLLQSRPQLKLPEEQFGDEDTADEDLDESSDSDEESEYDELPPFKRLTKDEVAKLTRAQERAYFDELEYREKLFMKKQLKEERKRRRMMKKMADLAKDMPSEYSENVEEESGIAASVPVPMPDLSLPASFDSDNPTHRYRYLDSANQWLVRPVLETHGWDHDVGYEGINVEKLFVVKEKIPLSFSGQVSKDKKESNLQMEIASSVKHGEGKATSLGFDMQTVGKDIAYTLRSETRLTNYRKNKATAGISATLLGDILTAGVKFEDKLIVNKRFRMVVTGGAMTGRGDVAYGGSLEATLRDKDHPLGRSLSTLGLSVMDWHGDLAIGCNIQSQIPIGRSTNMIARANLNNRGAGQVSIRLNSSEQLQIALIGLLPLFRKLFGYPQQMQYGQ